MLECYCSNLRWCTSYVSLQGTNVNYSNALKAFLLPHRFHGVAAADLSIEVQHRIFVEMGMYWNDYSSSQPHSFGHKKFVQEELQQLQYKDWMKDPEVLEAAAAYGTAEFVDKIPKLTQVMLDAYGAYQHLTPEERQDYDEEHGEGLPVLCRICLINGFHALERMAYFAISKLREVHAACARNSNLTVCNRLCIGGCARKSGR